MSDAKMAARIKALLAQAEHPNTGEKERLAFSAKAAELMEKYAIDELMARGVAEQHSDKIVRRDYAYNGVYSRALRNAVCALATALDMKAFYQDGRNDAVNIVVHGFESDFGKFETLLTSLMLQMNTAFKLWQKQHRDQWNALDSHDRFYSKRSFMMGYGTGFANRVKDSRNHAVQEASTGAELVLVDRKTRVEDHVNEAFKLKQGRNLMTNGAYDHGRAAGASASTGESPIGTRKAVR